MEAYLGPSRSLDQVLRGEGSPLRADEMLASGSVLVGHPTPMSSGPSPWRPVDKHDVVDSDWSPMGRHLMHPTSEPPAIELGMANYQVPISIEEEDSIEDKPRSLL